MPIASELLLSLANMDRVDHVDPRSGGLGIRIAAKFPSSLILHSLIGRIAEHLTTLGLIIPNFSLNPVVPTASQQSPACTEDSPSSTFSARCISAVVADLAVCREQG